MPEPISVNQTEHAAADELLARPGQPLAEHLRNVATLAGQFAEAITQSRSGEALGLAHDLGKASGFWQAYLQHSTTQDLLPDDEDYIDPKTHKGKPDHTTAGAQWLWGQKKITPDYLCCQILALCACSHHSGLIDCLCCDKDNKPVFAKRMQKGEDKTRRQESLDRLLAHYPDLCLLPDMATVLPELRKRCNALVTHCKGQFSSNLQAVLCPCNLGKEGRCGIHSPLAHFYLGLLTRFLFSCLVDADHSDSADADRPENRRLRGSDKPDWTALSGLLESHLSGFHGQGDLFDIRQRISATCLARAADSKGLFSLTVPTGGGKTLASLRFALHHAQMHKIERIIYVIPFTSIIDQNASVARSILEKDREFASVVLEHHSNLEPDKETPRSRLLAENWDAPIIFTTMVQFLECLFDSRTRAARRMHRLAKAVIIFDEIQTLPVNCVHLFCNALNFLVEECGSSAVLCTATQPLLHDPPNRVYGFLDLGPDRELMPDAVKLSESLRRVEIVDQTRTGGWNESEVAALALAERDWAGSCLVVVNTKAWAQTVYAECAKSGPDGVYHLSTNMCPAHRRKVLDAIKTRLNHKPPLPTICVSTQLIEAGVDISFAAAIRLLAGLDSIIQTAGRCNRNAENACGRVHILNAAQENLNRLREIKLGRDITERILREFKNDPAALGNSLLSLEAMKRYFSYAFYERRDEMTYKVNKDESGRDDTLLNLLSCNPLNGGHPGFKPALRQSFATAGQVFQVIDAPTEGVIMPYGEGINIIKELCSVWHPEEQRRLLKKAQLYTVNVMPNTLRNLYADRAIHETQEGSGVYYLLERYYSEKFGLSTTPVADMQPLICDGGANAE